MGRPVSQPLALAVAAAQGAELELVNHPIMDRLGSRWTAEAERLYNRPRASLVTCRVASLPPGVKGQPAYRVGCNPLLVESVVEAVTLTR